MMKAKYLLQLILLSSLLSTIACVPPPDASDQIKPVYQPVLSNMNICMSCHIPTGVAKNTSLVFNGGNEYQILLNHWQSTGQGTSNSLLATNSSGSNHAGGAIWVTGSSEYNKLIELLTLWNNGTTACSQC